MRSTTSLICLLMLTLCTGCERERVVGSDAPIPNKIEHGSDYRYPYPDHTEACSQSYIETLRTWIAHLPRDQRFVSEQRPLQPHRDLPPARDDDAFARIYVSPDVLSLGQKALEPSSLRNELDRLARERDENTNRVYEIGVHPDTALTRVHEVLSALNIREGEIISFTFSTSAPLRSIEPFPHHAEQYLVIEEGISHLSEKTLLSYRDAIDACDALSSYARELENRSDAERRAFDHTRLASVWRECGCKGDLDAVLLVLVGQHIGAKPMYEMRHHQRTASSKATGMKMHMQGRWAEYYTSFLGEYNAPLCIENLDTSASANALVCARDMLD